MSLSITAAIIVVPITTTRVTTTANTILDLNATKATFWSPTKAPVIVPVPVATIVAPRTPRIPITAIILEATSPPPSTTWMTRRHIKPVIGHSRVHRCDTGGQTAVQRATFPQDLTSSVLSHLDQLGVNGLVGLPQHRDQVAGLFHVIGGEEGVRSARFLTPGRASNAMDIILGGVRVVIIDDKFHILHICESVAVWQNKTWRPHGSLHTTTARPKETVSSWKGWRRRP